MTSGNAYSKIVVALAFGFLAGRLVDRFGPRRLMLVGIVMAGGALVGLSHGDQLRGVLLLLRFNALGYVFGGPLPNQVLLSRWFDRARGKAMGIAYLGHRRRRRARPAARLCADAGVRLARRAARARRAHDRGRAAGRLFVREPARARGRARRRPAPSLQRRS